MIYGRNAVREALNAGAGVKKLLFVSNASEEILSLVEKAREEGIETVPVEKDRLSFLTGTDRHQGVAASLKPFRFSDVDDMLRDASEKGEQPFLILLDSVQDPHNLGAIIRTAHQAGAHGVILMKNRSATVTPTVYKTSAGALHFMKVAEVTNLSRTVEELKKKGLWFVLADMGGRSLYEIDFTGPVGIIIGSEGSGASRLIREKADFIASIPMKGRIDSLNASVAAGILMYEAVRQRSVR